MRISLAKVEPALKSIGPKITLTKKENLFSEILILLLIRIIHLWCPQKSQKLWSLLPRNFGLISRPM